MQSAVAREIRPGAGARGPACRGCGTGPGHELPVQRLRGSLAEDSTQTP
jgi:hypothetical protein